MYSFIEMYKMSKKYMNKMNKNMAPCGAPNMLDPGDSTLPPYFNTPEHDYVDLHSQWDEPLTFVVCAIQLKHNVVNLRLAAHV